MKVYDRIAETLEFPGFFGNNLDALWDCLIGFIDPRVQIEMKGVTSLPDDLRDYTMEMANVFMEATNERADMEFTLVD